MNDLGSGVLIAIPREDAKQLFAAREPNQLRPLLHEFCNDRSRWQQGHVISCHGLAHQLQAALVAAVEEGPDRQLMTQCLTGGRPLAEDDKLTVRMVRPDAVPLLCQLLQPLDRSALPASDAAEDQLGHVFADLCQLYRAAEELSAAVVYARDESAA